MQACVVSLPLSLSVSLFLYAVNVNSSIINVSFTFFRTPADTLAHDTKLLHERQYSCRACTCGLCSINLWPCCFERARNVTRHVSTAVLIHPATELPQSHA